jgi:TrkA domain protein
MECKEIDLPGVGKKYAINTVDGERMTIILHTTGHREIYLFDQDADFPNAAVRMDDEEARQVGAILSGAFFQPVPSQDLETVLGELTIDWYRVKAGRLPGHTIEELHIRAETGVSVIAVIRPGSPDIPNPSPQTRIEDADTLVVIGSREQVDDFRRFAG